jgi:lactoylglutathione lyase
MKIDHLALWVQDLEKMKAFYEKYFNGKSNEKYHNPNKNFQSYFIKFPFGARIELMNNPDVKKESSALRQIGYAHLAFSLGSAEEVDRVTAFMKTEGFQIIDGPRKTGDGYYESAMLDPENNIIELTI